MFRAAYTPLMRVVMLRVVWVMRIPHVGLGQWRRLHDEWCTPLAHAAHVRHARHAGHAVLVVRGGGGGCGGR